MATIDFALLMVTCVVTAGAGIVVWLRVRVPGAVALAVMLLALAVNSGAWAMEFTTTSVLTKIAYEKLLMVALMAVPTLWLIFALQFTGRGRLITRTTLALLAIVPLTSAALVVTYPAQHLFWTGFAVAPGGARMGLAPDFGPAFWVHAAYSYALLAAGTVFLLILFRQSWNLYRGQAVLLLLAVSIPWVCDILYLASRSPIPGIDVSSVGTCVGALLFAFLLTRMRTVDVLRVSRTLILDSLPDGVVVVGAGERVLYSNPAGARFLSHVDGDGAASQAVADLWRGVPRPPDADGDGDGGAPLRWVDEEAGSYDLRFSPVVDTRQTTVARALVVRDVTAQCRVEEELRASSARLEQALDATVSALSAAVESRDPYTHGHQRRVAALARAMALELELDDERRRGLVVAAEVHDVGKINVPIEILCRPGRLSVDEFALVAGHAESGYEILRTISFPWPVADIVRQHHEKLDGSGYPRGLSGDEIILEARILCVADVVEAMASHRPYRPSLGLPAALDEVRKHRGGLYDAEAVDACLQVFERGEFVLPEA